MTVVTMVSVATVLLVLTGWGSAAASSISSVFVTNDPGHAVPVTAQGTTKVAEQNLDGSGNIKVHEQGTANVNVTNTARVQAAIPATAFSLVTRLGQTGPIHGPDPAGTKYAITSLTVTNQDGSSAAVVFLYGQFGATSDCVFSDNANTSSGPRVFVPPHATVHVDFPQPFVIPVNGNSSSCLEIDGALDVLVSAMVVGYTF